MLSVYTLYTLPSEDSITRPLRCGKVDIEIL
jgi:hypothetical protein